MASTTSAPTTVEDVKKNLTPDEQNEVDKPDFLEPLKLYLEGLNNIPNPTVETHTTHLERARFFAVQRTEVRNAIEANPHILKTEINPVVIIGMARSGTTLLQRLMASDPKFVSPMLWELLKPTPPGRPENWKETDRYNAAAETLERIFPNTSMLQHQHALNLDTPEECFMLLLPYFLCLAFNVHHAMEKWKNFCFYPPEENLTSAYKYYKMALQCIFYEGLKDGNKPLLKAPVHAIYFDTYRKVFPNAKFIFPYRNVRDMIGSACSLFDMVCQMIKLDCSKDDIKKYTLEHYRVTSSRVVQNIKEMPKESIFIVSYHELVKDPMKAMKEMYSQFNWKLTPETEEQLQNYMDENPQHKLGAHKYSLEEYGITDDEIRETLSEFLEYFGSKEKLM